MKVLAIDPGSAKCGLAIVDERSGVLARGVVPTETLYAVASAWCKAHRPHLLLVGRGTSLKRVRAELADLHLPLEIVREEHTTLRARVRYFEENPPRGWRRLIPRSLQTPPVPIDDYAAVLIAEDYLAAREEGESAPAH